MDNQTEIEELFNKNTLYKKIYDYVNNFQIKAYLEENKIPIDFGIKFLVSMLFNPTINIPSLVGLLSKNKTAQETANLITDCLNAELADYCNNRKICIQKELSCIPDSILKEINNYLYPLPYLDEPKLLKQNHEDIYNTYDNHIILGDKINRHNKDICLDHINKLNKVKFTLNQKVISYLKNSWKTKPTDTQEQLKKKQIALDKFNNESDDIQTSLLMQNNKFHFSHKYDKRGRTYITGYHINYMGNEYQKSCIELYNKEIIK